MARSDASPALANLSGVLWLSTLAAAAAAAASFLEGLPAAFGVALLVFIAAFAAGAFFGFLFGVPRVLSKDNGGQTEQAEALAKSPLAADPSTEASGKIIRPARSLQSNTNLERISDWLTTMIVGASLVQLHRINDYLLDFRGLISSQAKVFGEGATSHAGVLPVVAPVVLIFGAITGFLYMYLSTRLILIKLFAQIEEFLAGGDEKLPAAQSAQVRDAASDRGRGNFLQNVLSRTSQFTVSEALELMRSMLYKEGAYEEVKRIGATLATTSAARMADYWHLMAAAFGQEYAAAKDAGDADGMQSARDNALDCIRRALGIDPAYRLRFLNLTDPKGYDNDLAALYKDTPELRRLLQDQA